jgi:flavin reductase (DIM6/NTAB) family NADH-FMN oxidoreductase RutF
MKKINIDANTYVYPNPVTLVGVEVERKSNFMALGWVSRVNAKPPLIGIGVNRVHHTAKGILETKTFSINYPKSDMIDVADYCGLVSGKKVDKSNLFELFYGHLKTAPMIKECSLSMECKLINTIELPTNYFFIGEIVMSYTEEKYLTDGKLDIKKMNPLLLTMPDNSYWTIGEFVGNAWSIGKKLKEKNA